jgi:hypothetical protein
VINQGGAVSLALAFPFGGASRTVQLQESLDGTTWQTVNDVLMDAKGTATVLYLITSNRWFRVSYGGDSELLAGVGKAVRVQVRTGVALLPNTGTSVKAIKRGTTITFTASVNAGGTVPPATRLTWSIYKLVGKSWAFVTRRLATSNSAGKAILRWKFGTKGTWGIKVMAAATSRNAASPWSVMRRYSVR